MTRAALVLVCFGPVACSGSGVDWYIDAPTAPRHVGVHVQVRDGSCFGEVVHEEFVHGMGGQRLKSLQPGQYGFAATLLDASLCTSVAEGCVEAIVPRSEPVVTTAEPCEGDCACDGCELLCRQTDAAISPDANWDSGAGCSCSLPNAVSDCADHVCSIVACDLGFEDCDDRQATGCETNTRTSALNCGVCGVACLPGTACVNSVCESDE